MLSAPTFSSECVMKWRCRIRGANVGVCTALVLTLCACERSQESAPGNYSLPSIPVRGRFEIDTALASSTTPSGILALSDSLIAVIDSFDPVLSILSTRTGKVISRFGRRGGGPGELMIVGTVQQTADSSVLVSDPRLQRAIEFDFSRGSSRTRPLFQRGTPVGVLQRTIGYGGNDTWIALRRRQFLPSGNGPSTVADTPSLVASDSTGIREVIRLSPRRFVVVTIRGDAKVSSLSGLAPALVAACDSGFVEVDTSGVRRFNASGAVIGSHRHRVGWTSTPSALVQADISSLAANVTDVASRTATAELLQRQARDLTRLFAGFYIDPHGDVWIRNRTRDGSQIVRLSAAGAPTRAVDVPSGFGVVAVGVGYYVGMRFDAEKEVSAFTVFTFDAGPAKSSHWKCAQPASF